MKIGLQIFRFDWSGGQENIAPTLRTIARTAEEAGFYSVWVMDHFFQMEMMLPAEQPMLEGYTAMTYIAALTECMKLGILVTGNIYRHPGHLIKVVTTLDVLSGGRAYLGIGAGWYERESLGLGLPFPSMKERFERLEETLQIAHQMWKDDLTPINGQHYQLAEPMNHPQPVSRPHPPIMIGGGGEKKTLRMVAQYGDACNLFSGGSLKDVQAAKEQIRHKLDVLREHCQTLGRNYDEIERTALGSATLTAGGLSAAEVVDMCGELAEVGIQHAIFNMNNIQEIIPLEIFGRDIIPAVAAL